MRFFALYIFIVMIAGTTCAQDLTLGVEGNIGFYDMSSLKESQRLPTNYPIAFQSVQNFPATTGVRIQTLLKVNSYLRVGLFTGGTNTASRLTYSDLTGQRYRDVNVSALYIGATTRAEVFSNGPWSFHGRLAAGSILNKIKFESRLHIADPDIDVLESSEWKSNNFFFDIGFEAGYTWQGVYMKAFASNETSIAGKPDFKSGSRLYPENNNFTVEWDGIRIGVGLEYQILKRKP